MKLPYAEQSKDEKGNLEFSLHQLNEDDVLSLCSLIKRSSERTMDACKLLNEQISDMMLRRLNTNLQLMDSMQRQVQYLREKYLRQRRIFTSIEKVFNKARNFSEDEITPEFATFQSQLNNQ